MVRDNRKRLKRHMASAWQHFEKAALEAAFLKDIFAESDPRLGEMVQLIGFTAIDGQRMIEALWKEIWAVLPEKIHPEMV